MPAPTLPVPTLTVLNETLTQPPAQGLQRPRSRGGRPSNAMAGEVEERLLEAARIVFLERGYEGASFEQIAETARAGKATLYAHYHSKEGLFTAVMKRSIDRTMRFVEDIPSSAPLRDRLSAAANVILDRSLSGEVLALMRLVVAEAPRFPVLASLADENGRKRAIGAVARIMAADSGDGPGNIADEPPARVVEAARHFMDLVFAPMMLRGLLGADIEMLRLEAPAHVAHAIALATDSSGAIFGIRDAQDDADTAPAASA